MRNAAKDTFFKQVIVLELNSKSFSFAAFSLSTNAIELTREDRRHYQQHRGTRENRNVRNPMKVVRTT